MVAIMSSNLVPIDHEPDVNLLPASEALVKHTSAI